MRALLLFTLVALAATSATGAAISTVNKGWFANAWASVVSAASTVYSTVYGWVSVPFNWLWMKFLTSHSIVQSIMIMLFVSGIMAIITPIIRRAVNYCLYGRCSCGWCCKCCRKKSKQQTQKELQDEWDEIKSNVAPPADEEEYIPAPEVESSIYPRTPYKLRERVSKDYREPEDDE